MKTGRGARVGAWQKRAKEMDRVNVGMHRGRTVPMEGFEVFVARLVPTGHIHFIDLKPGQWYFAFEQPDKAPTIVGPITPEERRERRQGRYRGRRGGAD